MDNPSHAQFAGRLLSELLREVETKLHTETDFLLRSRLEEAQQLFTVRPCYSHGEALLLSR